MQAAQYQLFYYNASNIFILNFKSTCTTQKAFYIKELNDRAFSGKELFF